MSIQKKEIPNVKVKTSKLKSTAIITGALRNKAGIAVQKRVPRQLLQRTGTDEVRQTRKYRIPTDIAVAKAVMVKRGMANVPEETNRLTALTEIALNIFSVFEIKDEDAAQLLGYSPSSRTLISNMRQGTATIPNKQSAIRRANYLIRLHYSLSDLYDKNLQTCALWLRSGQERLEQKTPINFMIERGEVGMKQVVDWVEKVNGR